MTTLRERLAGIEMSDDDRARVDRFLDAQDAAEKASAKRWSEYERIRHLHGTETADIAMQMVKISERTGDDIWDVAALHAHRFLVATSTYRKG